MIIHTPGFPTRYVDEAPPAAIPAAEGESPFPSVAQAMALAEQRQILSYTQQPAPPLPLKGDLPASPDTVSGQSVPHSVNDEPEVT